FTASAGMNLCLHHIKRPRQLFCGCDGFFNSQSGMAGRDADAIFGELFFGLIFMDIHGTVQRLSIYRLSESCEGLKHSQGGNSTLISDNFHAPYGSRTNDYRARYGVIALSRGKYVRNTGVSLP